MARIALGVEYDGSAFCGWQSQTNGRSVQDAVELALAKVADSPIRVHCAGRTDTGVHALEQVVHFDSDVERPESAWSRGTNAYLPASVSILWAKYVSDEFHARFSATARTYRYLLLNRNSRPGLEHGRVGWYHRDLDLDAMDVALTQLKGTHDFTSFRSSECQAKSPIRTLSTASVRRDGDLFCFDFVADGFLHHMIRNIIGALVYVGNGKQSPESIAELIAARDRRIAPPTFSPDGLYFVHANYDERFNLPKLSRGDTAPVARGLGLKER